MRQDYLTPYGRYTGGDVRLILIALLLVMLVPVLGPGSGSDAQAKDAPRAVTAADRSRMSAIDEGLRYLWSIQNRDGSWDETQNGIIGITSLCLLAFMAQGHQEGRGEYAALDRDRSLGATVRRGVDYLSKRSLPPSPNNPLVSTTRGKPAGFIYHPDDPNSRMHGHGYATQVLVLAYGAARERDPRTADLKVKIQRAVRVIEEAQTITGGWGYEPAHASSHEGSVTVTVVQALRQARDAGFVVDKEVHDRGLRYLLDSQKSDGSFKYALMEDRSTPALTAAAVTAMYGFGEYYSRTIRRGLEFMAPHYEHPGQLEWTFYGNYYAAQAFYQAGGRFWHRWTRRAVPWIVESRIRTRRTYAFWDDELTGNSPHPNGRAYATAMAILALSVQDGFLPLFQR